MKRKNERILSYVISKKISEKDLADVSAAGSSVATTHGTYSSMSGYDVDIDVNYDL